MNHADAIELAGLYVLDALEPHERALVDAHIESCPETHHEFAEVGGVAPALATLAEPVGAPASLKNKVMADYRAGAGARVWEPASVAPAAPVRPTGQARPSWLGWAATAAAVLLISVTAGWAYVAQQNADLDAQRSQLIAQAIDVMAAPGSSVAVMHGSAQAAGASGFVAFGADGTGYIVLVAMPAAPTGHVYEAWNIADGVPTPAGLMTIDRDGYAVMPMNHKPGTEVIALTIEPTGGSEQPTTDPIVAGELRSNSAAS